MTISTITLLSILTIASLTDLQHQKIPNILTIPAMLFGIINNFLISSIDGLTFSIEGLLLGIGLLLIFYISGMMGAGDVKLMGAVGSIVGPYEVFQAFLFTAFAGGAYAMIVLAVHGQLFTFLKRVGHSLHLSIMNRRLTMIPNNGEKAPLLCYGIAIAVGTAISIFI
jgi:prepilin peptidase CpaA